MKFEEILQIITEPKFRKILNDQSLTDFQKAADIHAELEADNDSKPFAQPRKSRTIKPKPEIENRDGRPTHTDGEIG